MCDTDDKRDLLTVGGGISMIFGPDGAPLVERRPETLEGVIYHGVDLPKISLAKAAADPAGPNAKADVLRLMINRRPNVRVHEFGTAFDVLASSSSTLVADADARNPPPLRGATSDLAERVETAVDRKRPHINGDFR